MTDMATAISQAAQTALGGPLPPEITVSIDYQQRIVTMVGPPASGKTRTWRALPAQVTEGWRLHSGWMPDRLYDETDGGSRPVKRRRKNARNPD